MIFMERVVAMHRIVATEIAEAEKELSPLIEVKREDVFPRVLHVCKFIEASAEYLELFKMNMDWMLPFAAAILQDPSLNAISLHSEPNLIAAHEAVIDNPAAVRLVEGE